MVFRLDLPSDSRLLAEWFLHCDTILGMNLTFDLTYLRCFDPRFRLLLSGRHTLIDLSVVNYLHAEMRPEKSLKNLGPILRTHLYPPSIKDFRFPSPSTPVVLPAEPLAPARSDTLLTYNAMDTHFTVLSIRELARRIRRDYGENQCPHKTSPSSCSWPSFSPGSSGPTSPASSAPVTSPAFTSKLTPDSILFYSDSIWSVVAMTEAGVALSLPRLRDLESRLLTRVRRCETLCQRRFNLPLSGGGSHKARSSFLSLLTQEIDRRSPASSVLDHPLLQYTEKRRELSFSDQNRSLLRNLLPPRHPYRRALNLVDRHASASKLLSGYTFPLLRHKRKQKRGAPDTSSLVLPVEGEVGLSYPTWMIVPTSAKEGMGATGGTLQARITCKNHHHQTDPPEIQACYTSRYPSGVLLKFDLSQIELRVAALLSGEPSMVDAYSDPRRDLHEERAVSIFTEPFLIQKYGLDFRKDKAFRKSTLGERQVAKHVNFADLFWASAHTMQSTVLEMTGALYPLPFFQAIERSRPSTRPGLFAWQQSLVGEARRRGYLELPILGISRRFLGGSKYDLSEIVNFPVQAYAAAILLSLHSTLNRLSNPLATEHPDFVVSLNIYDALLVDCRSSAAAASARGLLARACSLVEGEGLWSRLPRPSPSVHVPLSFEIQEL